ncbi:hypothetical protein K6973_01345 [Streptococcus dysgalactiae]|nr:hypothetical protein [Streptococcus dysgalactiae]QZT27438.1 hypothetical protein K6973_01345 [Streptococcus dysgalactiae]
MEHRKGFRLFMALSVGWTLSQLSDEGSNEWYPEYDQLLTLKWQPFLPIGKEKSLPMSVTG